MENQIINSKLIPPIPSATYMRRSSFIQKMKIAEHYRLTILHSGPGFGKSLGVAQYFKDVDVTYSWYTVTAEDDDIIPFTSYITASICRTLPTFGKTLINLTSSSTFIKEEVLRQWLALFINELCELSEPLTIIIDDYHLVDHVFQINFLMEKMIELLPPHVKVIIATRSCPKWSNLLKLAMNNQYYEMTEVDLVFSEEEITVYLEDYFNINIDEEKAKEIVHLTEGWAIAVNLMALTLAESKLSFSIMMKPVFQNIFDYLSEEVYQSRSEKEQKWLLAFAIFPTFSVPLLEDFYNGEAVTMLNKLVVEHGFIQSLGEEDTYRYHALFQRFLMNKWKELDYNKYIVLHKKATTYYFEQDNFMQATYHASETKDEAFIGKTLVRTALPLIRSGQFDWYLEIFNRLPESVKNQYYALYYFEGEVLRYQAFYEQARNAYVNCLFYAKKENDFYYSSRSYAGIAHIFLDTIQPALAETHLIKAIESAQQTDRMNVKEIAMLKRQFAENLVNLGKAKDAQQWVENEYLSPTILREGNLDARIFLRMGKLAEAKTLLHEHIVKRTALPDSHRETEILLSLINSMMGEVQVALQNAEKGIKIGEKVQSSFIEAVGYTRAGHAKMLSYPFMLEEAEKSYLRAIKMMDGLKVSRVKAEPLMGLAVLKARQRLFREAIHYGKAALRETEEVNDGWMSGLIRTSLAIIYFYEKDYEQSKHHIEVAKKLYEASGDLFGEMVALFWLMHITFSTGALNRLYILAERFAEIYVREDYLFFLHRDTMFGPFDKQMIYPLWNEVSKTRENNEMIQMIAQDINLIAYENHPGYQLYTKSLGRFQLILGSDVVEETAWQREKAKEMLLYFLLNKKRYIHKEEMMQALWENVETKTADRNFKVTMNALLKVLEPNRKARQQSFFIERKNTGYRINPKAVVNGDFDLFLKYTEEGMTEKKTKQAIVNLLKANSFYKGIPFEEFRDANWILQERETLINKYALLLERLAQHYLKEKEYEQVIIWAEKLIKLDRTWEEAYRLLMLAYYRLHNRSQSIKWYEKCVTALKIELNIHPMETTNELVRMIMQPEE